MARNKEFVHAQTVKLKQLERSLIAYYSHLFNMDSSKVIRSMIRNYVRADTSFNGKAYEKFVKDHLASAEPDEEVASALRAAARGFVSNPEK